LLRRDSFFIPWGGLFFSCWLRCCGGVYGGIVVGSGRVLSSRPDFGHHTFSKCGCIFSLSAQTPLFLCHYSVLRPVPLMQMTLRAKEDRSANANQVFTFDNYPSLPLQMLLMVRDHFLINSFISGDHTHKLSSLFHAGIFTPEETQALLDGVETVGTKWVKILKCTPALGNRSEGDLKNRWKTLLKMAK
jgi:hypothetical protein